MIFCEYTLPMPGRASSSSLLAEFRSTNFDDVLVDFVLLDEVAFAVFDKPFCFGCAVISARVISKRKIHRIGFITSSLTSTDAVAV